MHENNKKSAMLTNNEKNAEKEINYSRGGAGSR